MCQVNTCIYLHISLIINLNKGKQHVIITFHFSVHQKRQTKEVLLQLHTKHFLKSLHLLQIGTQIIWISQWNKYTRKNISTLAANKKWLIIWAFGNSFSLSQHVYDWKNTSLFSLGILAYTKNITYYSVIKYRRKMIYKEARNIVKLKSVQK